MKNRLVSLVLVFCSLLIISLSARADTDEEKLKVAQEMIDAWNTLNWERVYTLFTEDGVLHSVMH